MSILVINGTSIIDREIETKRILQLLHDCADKKVSHAVLLCADSGYGKSSVMNKVSAMDDDIAKRIVVVDTPPVNSDSVPIEGQYLNYIANNINRKTKYSLEDYLYSPDSEYQSQIDTATILQAGHSMHSAVAAKAGQHLLADLTAQRLLYDTSPDGVLVLKDYIRASIYKTDIILDITNAQNMDSRSYQVVSDLLQPHFKTQFIFEYTTKNSSFEKAARFAQGLGCAHSLVKIEELPFEFALTIFGVPAAPQKIVEIEKFYRDVVKGNLYRITQAKMDAADNIINFSDDPIDEKVRKLGFANKMLLSILCLHDGEMNYHDFLDILNEVKETFFIPIDWKDALETLLAFNEDKICLRHASISESLALTRDDAAALSTYQYLVGYYEKRSKSKDILEQNQAVVQLVKLHSRFDPERMPLLLGQFKNVIINRISETAALALIRQAFDSLGATSETIYHLKLVRLCYEAGLYQGALELLEKLKPLSSDFGNVLMCMLLNRNDRHVQAIELSDRLFKIVKNHRYKLIVLMIKMLSERSLNQVKRYKNTFHKIEGTTEFHDFLECGFFLRNAQIVKSYLESLQYLRESIDFFHEKNEAQYAAYSKLTYAIQLARLGYLDSSKESLAEIEAHLLGVSFEKHIVYVNQAAIRLLDGHADKITSRLLDKALLTVTTEFDRIVILNNMICAVIINRGPHGDFECLQEILEAELKKEPDQKLRLKTYTNFYLYYKNIRGDADMAQQWQEKAAKIAEMIKGGPQTIERIFLFHEPPEEDLKFLSTRNYCISFITYWHFDIPILDE